MNLGPLTLPGAGFNFRERLNNGQARPRMEIPNGGPLSRLHLRKVLKGEIQDSPAE